MEKFDKENTTILIEKFKTEWPVSDWIEVGFFTEKYLEEINLHWLKFSPPHKYSFVTLAVLYIFIMSAGIFGNMLVIYVYIRCKSLRTSANILIINLAVSDCLMMFKMPMFIYNSFKGGPALGDLACRIYGFIGGLTGTVSISILTAISLDRFYVIKYPLSRKFTNLRVKLSMAASWLYGIFFSIIPALDIGLGKYTPEGYLTSCSFDYLTDNQAEKSFIIIFCIAAWVLPLIIITFSYLNIVHAVLQRSITSKKERESFRHVRAEDKKRQEVKLAIVVLVVVFVWFIAWTPYTVVALLGITNNKEWITPISSMIPALMAKTASAIDPFVYALSHPKFKQEINRLFCGKIQRRSSKVWTSDHRRNAPAQIDFRGSIDEDDVEVEIVQIDLKEFVGGTSGREIGNLGQQQELGMSRRKLKRETSIAKLLCIKPNFSNKSSNIRKIVRRWSVKELERRQSQD